MEKITSYISLVLVVLLFGIYFTREYTRAEYNEKFEEIRAIKDSLNNQVNRINKKVVERDSILQAEINQSFDFIKLLNKRRSAKKEEIEAFDKKIDSLIIILKD